MKTYVLEVFESTVKTYWLRAESPEAAQATFEAMPGIDAANHLGQVKRLECFVQSVEEDLPTLTNIISPAFRPKQEQRR